VWVFGGWLRGDPYPYPPYPYRVPARVHKPVTNTNQKRFEPWLYWKTCLMWQENTKGDSRGGSEPKCIWKDEVEREREYAIRSVLYIGSDGWLMLSIYPGTSALHVPTPCRFARSLSNCAITTCSFLFSVSLTFFDRDPCSPSSLRRRLIVETLINDDHEYIYWKYTISPYVDTRVPLQESHDLCITCLALSMIPFQSWNKFCIVNTSCKIKLVAAH